jgi:threonine/homoserine/homoserine lactone efflux protein
MPPDLLLPLAALAFAASWTPGPNNALVAASGANFGLARTLPHIFGIGLGFPVMVFVVGLILGELFAASTAFQTALRWGGAAVMLWVAWAIARGGGLGRPDAPRPFTFVEAAAFQWVNPKGWVMALAIPAQFVQPDRPHASALAVAVVFAAAGLSSSLAWAGLGQAMRRFLSAPSHLRLFNTAMGALVAASVVGMLAQGA